MLTKVDKNHSLLKGKWNNHYTIIKSRYNGKISGRRGSLPDRGG